MANGYLERCSPSLAIEEMQIKPTMSYPYTPIRMAKVKLETTSNVGKDGEKLDHSPVAGGDVSGTAILENILEASYKAKHTNTIQSSNCVCGH